VVKNKLQSPKNSTDLLPILTVYQTGSNLQQGAFFVLGQLLPTVKTVGDLRNTLLR
jgi:hypothetical protein